MNICKNKFLNILLNILIIVVLPSAFGFALYFYLEYLIWFVFLIPGIAAFFGEALNNGGKM